MSILGKIVQYKREELEHFRRKLSLQDLKDRVRDCGDTRSLIGAIQRPVAEFAVIAEIKKMSPSKGVIRDDFTPQIIARSYAENGASALSVLTDEHFFGGHIDHLRQVRSEVDLPILRKDFVWDPYQIFVAREAGADAVLLIVAMLEPNQIVDLQGLAGELGLDVLVEVHDPGEAEVAISADAKLIGVNNRDLKTFNVDTGLSQRLFSSMPSEITKISESGIRDRKTLINLQQAGADGFLIGEAFMKAKVPGEALKELIG